MYCVHNNMRGAELPRPTEMWEERRKYYTHAWAAIALYCAMALLIWAQKWLRIVRLGESSIMNLSRHVFFCKKKKRKSISVN
jgi:hypothetical protein